MRVFRQQNVLCRTEKHTGDTGGGPGGAAGGASARGGAAGASAGGAGEDTTSSSKSALQLDTFAILTDTFLPCIWDSYRILHPLALLSTLRRLREKFVWTLWVSKVSTLCCLCRGHVRITTWNPQKWHIRRSFKKGEASNTNWTPRQPVLVIVRLFPAQGQKHCKNRTEALVNAWNGPDVGSWSCKAKPENPPTNQKNNANVAKM